MDVIEDWHQVKRTRKNHQCEGCLVTIEKGSICWCATYADFGDIYHSRICDDCMSFLHSLPHDYFDAFDGWCPGDLAMAKREEGWNAEKSKLV